MFVAGMKEDSEVINAHWFIQWQRQVESGNKTLGYECKIRVVPHGGHAWDPAIVVFGQHAGNTDMQVREPVGHMHAVGIPHLAGPYAQSSQYIGEGIQASQLRPAGHSSGSPHPSLVGIPHLSGSYSQMLQHQVNASSGFDVGYHSFVNPVFHGMLPVPIVSAGRPDITDCQGLPSFHPVQGNVLNKPTMVSNGAQALHAGLIV
ncbi:hypothetical protein L7F22_026082 [Adiantum nelumboides]|nr:hypothetical protein [Adiantum nelumboides]